MKILTATFAIAFLLVPVLWHASFERRVEQAQRVDDVVLALAGVTGGLVLGAVGVFFMGVLFDGVGYRPVWLLALAIVIGAMWCGFYPNGWLLGAPLVLYSGVKLLPRKSERGRE